MNPPDMSSYKDREILFQRMIEKLSGSISEGDEQALDRLIQTDEAVKQLWRHLQQSFHTGDLQDKMARFEDDDYWKPMPVTHPGGRSHKRAFMLKAAAILAGVSVGGYLLFLLLSTRIGRVSAPPAAEIQLQLANGQTIGLSRQGTVKAKGVTLFSTSESLSYAGSTDAGGINTLKVPFGHDYKISLSDGTEIWLNAATQLQFPFRFTGSTREITLDGEAYLQVAGDATHPFIVHTHSGTIRVLGTAFNINSYEKGMIRVSLVSGAVKVQAAGREVQLSPGQEAACQPGADRITVQPFEADHRLSWREGIYYFDNAPIQELSGFFQRWYGLSVTIDNAGVGAERFSGILNRRQPVEEFMKALKATTELDYFFDKDSVLHIK
ncbi:DUF4974 domain-containing protein [Chitinophaga agrisoli]|uniref:DUF4974 domain-containing protein n=1 Tax=Chitinophaga agrisoli TaxID=2607653 RepID=A0A5B2VLM1_9BACT|nr:FecR domain-containing protein [Chitinophaga agrisoli]KAA2239754.1 DUF4974 domain-containing protein [Chitinophaga agrisoli]